MKNATLRIVCFLALLATVLYYVNSVFAFKDGDGIYSYKKFYELENNTVDVLVLGSSHAFESVNTGMLWQEHGISSFILGGSIQPIYNAYYALKETLKTQSPSLIILEAYTLTKTEEYSDDIRIIKNTYGMKWSRNKIDAIKTSAPKERWLEFMFGYIQYHTRYTSLSKADFVKNQGNPLFENWKGFGCNMATNAFDKPNVQNVTDRLMLSEKQEEYYRKIIELAIESQIPLLVMVSPYAGISEEEQARYNTVSDIAGSYNVNFINYNLLYDEIGLDFSSDAADVSHLNYKGNQKFTHALGEYITDHYDIPDRRGDAKYASWEADSQYISASIKNQQLLEANNLSDIIYHLMDQEYELFVSTDGYGNTADDRMAPLFNALGIPRDKGSEIWHVNTKHGVLYASGAEAAQETMRLGSYQVCLSRSLDESSQNYLNSVIIDNTKLQTVSNGINITVYNPLTQNIVCSFGFDMSNQYNLVR